MKLIYSIPTVAAMHDFAARIARISQAGDCIGLSGDLGAGKTEFARGFIRALAGDTTEVTSPSFTLVQIYDSMTAPIWHIDLYRLESVSELPALGLEDGFMGGICLIEWPALALSIMPDEWLNIQLTMAENNQRQIVLEPYGGWVMRLKNDE